MDFSPAAKRAFLPAAPLAEKVQILVEIGDVCLNKLEDPVRAIAAYREALQIEPENHRLLLADFADGAPFADLYQVHGNAVAEAECGTRPEADGIVTTERDLVLLVRTADCVPVLFADEAAGVIGAAHAGRKGMAVGVVPATIARMRALGATRIPASARAIASANRAQSVDGAEHPDAESAGRCVHGHRVG